jgi:formylglycine-generating enzyme required for sulfatase activity
MIEPPTARLGKDGKRMIFIPSGWFVMGTNESAVLEKVMSFLEEREGCAAETPQHRVYLEAFYIDETPVTYAEYKCFLEAHLDRPAPRDWDRQRRTFPPPKADHPVVYVSWHDAMDYARWAGKRLPTEAQWEKAARGTDRRLYPWGNDFDPARCNSWEMGIRGTTPVTQYAPHGNSPYGVMDLAGNVWEWCADWYDPHYYETSPLYNPTGPRAGIFRVLRGGAWSTDPEAKRVTHRGYCYPTYDNVLVGFRCVAPIEIQGKASGSNGRNANQN